MKYLVTIEETLSKTVLIEAESEEEAVDIVEDKYRNADIILDSENFCDKEITARLSTHDDDISLYEEIEGEI